MFTLSVWPGAAARTFPLLQSHTQIMFFESKPTDTKHWKREQRKMHHRLNKLLSYIHRYALSHLHSGMVGHNERANNGYSKEENSCPAPGTSTEHICVLLQEESPIADWLSRQQQQWSRRGGQLLWKSFYALQFALLVKGCHFNALFGYVQICVVRHVCSFKLYLKKSMQIWWTKRRKQVQPCVWWASGVAVRMVWQMVRFNIYLMDCQ